ncbi:hypothetical protein [Pacificoceanicola onchidii]|uniref:hypothetical protein n=1 Tax=Pacificoceanicola onchidii TaxID=2562685 RepID=UPI0010A64F6E|nr:hypothetical protein [Pacificoceanicola onchidii]
MTKTTKSLAFGLLLAGTAISAEAATIQFTATSASAGEIGWFQMDDAAFSGACCSSWYDNSLITALFFSDPVTGAWLTIEDINLGSPGNEAEVRIDASGTLPAFENGRFSFAVDENFFEVSFSGTQYIDFYGGAPDYAYNGYSDVSWSTGFALSSVPTAAEVPLPASGLLLAGTLGLAGAARRARRKG